MPTIRELLELDFQTYLRAQQRGCWNCEGNGFTAGEYVDKRVDGDRVVHEYEKIVCDKCKGSGEGAIEVGFAVSAMMGVVVRTAVQARDEARFGEMNEILDWGLDLLNKSLKHYVETDLEGAQEALKKISDAQQDVLEGRKKSPIQVSGALTQDELRKLGLDDG